MTPDYHRHIDNKIRLSRPVWIALAVLGVIAVVSAGFLWGRRIGSMDTPSKRTFSGDEARIVVFLAFPKGDELEMVAREIPENSDPLVLGEHIVRGLLIGPEVEDFGRIMSEKADLRAFYIDGNGIAYIDLDRQALNIPRDALGEYMAIQSFFESLRRNIPGIKGVKFLIDSGEVDSLWGHFDASQPWTAEYEAP